MAGAEVFFTALYRTESNEQHAFDMKGLSDVSTARYKSEQPVHCGLCSMQGCIWVDSTVTSHIPCTTNDIGKQLFTHSNVDTSLQLIL